MRAAGKSLEDIKKEMLVEFTEFSTWGKGGRLDSQVRSEVLARSAPLDYINEPGTGSPFLV